VLFPTDKRSAQRGSPPPPGGGVESCFFFFFFFLTQALSPADARPNFSTFFCGGWESRFPDSFFLLATDPPVVFFSKIDSSPHCPDVGVSRTRLRFFSRREVYVKFPPDVAAAVITYTLFVQECPLRPDMGSLAFLRPPSGRTPPPTATKTHAVVNRFSLPSR